MRAASALARSEAERRGSSGWPYLSGTCVVCGESVWFFARPGTGLRETLVCSSCDTTSRYRSVARGILRAIKDVAGVDAACIADLPDAAPTQVSILDTQVPFSFPAVSGYPIPDLLDRRAWIDVSCSQFKPDLPWGAELGSCTTNQTLEALTFPDDSFDVVVTSDVLEHVRLDDPALQEIARVLRPGGCFVFTVPHTRGQRETIVKVIVHDPDRPELDEIIGEPEYHGSGDPDEAGGVLSYRVYGTALDERLASLGLAVDYSSADLPDLGIVETELFYCRGAEVISQG
jgi:SAM-dependent methyltransferase